MAEPIVEPQVQITVLDADKYEGDAQWQKNAQIMLTLYSHAPQLYDMLYTLMQCYGHDWKQRHQDNVKELLKNG